MIRRLASTFAVVVTLGCTAPSGMETAQILGEWEKPEQTLPPIHLTLRQDGDAIRAMLRLSGTEAQGTALIDGTDIRLDLAGRTTPLHGQIISSTELRLQLDPSAEPYRLRKLD